DRRVGLELRGVEAVKGLVEVEVAGVAGAGELRFEFGADVAVVREKAEGPGKGVLDEGFADKDFGGVSGVDFAVADGARFDFQAVQAGALLDEHAAFFEVPEGLGVAALEQVFAEVERPERIKPRDGAGVEPRGLHDLGGKNPAGTLRVVFLARVVAARRVFSVFALVQAGAGEDGDAAVLGGAVAAFFLAALGDVAGQAGEDAAVEGAVAGRGEAEAVGAGLVGRHAVVDGGGFEAGAVLDDVNELGVHIAPLTHAGVAEEVVFAEAAALGLGKAFKLVVAGVPDAEQGEATRIGAGEAAVVRVGLR